ncbi:hypothetical protein D1632_00255 [Chryseobacterium nematophagum]|uniref:Uncharacterized protein n=1 Tax=Chryseobacterium nematophagum TaxID=2305228 RepID=A0A3M7LEX0_9FLAO|nr:hypothetical protein [Chryseobacterium nematophagum]RMZ61278.1 hypothetical protein D1632_00255 [Chryseobacterium nematophagum]
MEDFNYIFIEREDLLAIVDRYEYGFYASTELDKEEVISNLTENLPGVKYFHKDLTGISDEIKNEAIAIYNKLVKEDEERSRIAERKHNIVTTFGFIIIALIIIYLIGFIVSRESIYVKSTYKKVMEISSLKSVSALNGSFSFGRGFVNEEDYYFFLVRDQEGFVKCKAPSSTTLLIEKDTVPSFTKYYLIQKTIKSEGFFIWKLKETIETDTIDYIHTYRNKYNAVLTIPKGSIEETQNYNSL